MTWPNAFPFALTAAGVTLTRTGSGGYAVSGLGTAEPIDLPTRADAFGARMRITRCAGEDDWSYLGRVQRLLAVACMRLPSGSEGRVARTVAAHLGRVSLVPWSGTSGVPPSGCAFLDLLDRPQTADSFSLTDGRVVAEPSLASYAPGGMAAGFRCPADLSARRHRVFSDGAALVSGRDYLIGEDPATLLLRVAPQVSLKVDVGEGDPVRLNSGPLTLGGSSLSRESLPSPYGSRLGTAGLQGLTPLASSASGIGFPPATLSASQTASGTLFLGCVQAVGAPRAEMRSLRLPGGLPSAEGFGLLPPVPTPRWADPTSPPSPLGIPMDLEG